MTKRNSFRDSPGSRGLKSHAWLQYFLATVCFNLATPTDAQESAQVRQIAEPNTASIELFQQEAAEYQITLKDGRKADLNPTPVLKWSNDVRSDQDGALFVWMLDDRPQILGCVFTYYYQGQERRKHQLHSLATHGLSAAIDDAPVWQPGSSGLKFAVVPNAGVPETDASKQKLQLRRLSRRFSAELEDEKGGTTELRLMPTPLITYTPQRPDCIAGGILAFATGTDPDLLLVLEVRSINEKPAWNYAFARFHYCRLTAELDGTQVWEVPKELAMKTDRRENSAFRESVYVSFRTK